MRFGTSVPAFADFSDPRVLAELAHDAEAAGNRLATRASNTI